MPAYPRPLPSFDYRGFHRYFLTFCTFERNPYFRNDPSVELVTAQILRAAAEHRHAVLAYCFMPDHLHLLVEGTTENADLKCFVTRAKQYSGFYYKRATRNTLWQRYGFERVLRADKDARDVVRYVVSNPVRAGLVIDPLAYPFWGSSIYSRTQLIEYLQMTERPRAG